MIGGLLHTRESKASSEPMTFIIGQFGCMHSDKDIQDSARYPFTEAMEAMSLAGFNPDAIHTLGDWTGLQSVTEPAKDLAIERIGDDIDEAISGLSSVFICSITGNHIGEADSFDLYERAVDSKINAVNTDTRTITRDPKRDYDWDGYYYLEGNILMYFIGDRNDIPAPWGKDGSAYGGGHPSGAVKYSSVQHFIGACMLHFDKSVFLHTHQGLPNTVIGTKVNDGHPSHNDDPPTVASHKGTVGVLWNGTTALENDTIWDKMMTEHDALVCTAGNAHTHGPLNDEYPAGFGHFGRIGKTFICNYGNLTQDHGLSSNPNQHPHGSIMEFVEGQSSYNLYKLICKDHTLLNTAEEVSKGDLYPPYFRNVALKNAFSYQASVDPVAPEDPAISIDGNELTITGTANGFVIYTSASTITYTPTDDQWEGVIGYEVAAGVTLESITNQSSYTFDSVPNEVRVYAWNGGNGKLKFSNPVDL